MSDEPSEEVSRNGRRRRRSESLPPDPDVDDIAAALLGRPRSLARRDVSSGAAVSLLSARKLWHALGFPLVTSDEELFTEADLYALRTVAKIVREGTMDETTALAHTRAFARTADRLAAWQVQLVAESISPQEGRDGIGPLAVPDVATAKAAAIQLIDLVDELEPLLVYAWRRHLTDAISRMISDAEPSTDEHGMWRHIGFADLVAFTNLVRRLSERELSVVVKRFEVLTSDIVTAHGGRIIKTVGDEILFSNREAAPAAATALDLVDAMSDDDVLPDVRVGMAAGPVLSRLGDVFGTTVNRASRLTSIAQPGNVLIDGQMAHSLDSVSGFDLTPLRSRALRGVGKVKPYVLARAGADTRRGTPDETTPEQRERDGR
ncbi:adenylate/guanylate cyclase domain-containing protein [Lapillicoccus sp.]|uniref:adenylate/guanylate cyclase domain-containing protein n=1 Tax=Lapillicoccus sp. TaxID=1909287 RepID=UPI0025DCFE52|nr:adenylate/guanylate cyclase domain-containing protein [Lapillicoccus sp.]